MYEMTSSSLLTIMQNLREEGPCYVRLADDPVPKEA